MRRGQDTRHLSLSVQLDVVDGVYDADPRTNPEAKKYETIGYSEVISKELKVMDATAVTLCRENKMPIRVFALSPGNIRKVVEGEPIGTLVGAPNDVQAEAPTS